MIFLKKMAFRFREFLIYPLQNESTNYYPQADAASQLMLKLAYSYLANSGMTLPILSEVGFKAYSQTDEDGILLFIFSVIGTDG